MGQVLFHQSILEHIIWDYGHWKYLGLLDGTAVLQDDLNILPDDAEAASVHTNTINMGRLCTLNNLKTLYIKNPSKQHLEIIAKCKSLKCLVLSESRSRNISLYEDLFRQIPQLQELILDRYTPISSLDVLKYLPDLKCLCLKSMRKIKCIDGLEHCHELRYFSFETWFEEFQYKLDNLNALKNLQKLEVLSLESLHRISNPPRCKEWTFLNNLKFISLPNASFEIEDLAFLKKYHSDIKGAPTYPYTALIGEAFDEIRSAEDLDLPFLIPETSAVHNKGDFVDNNKDLIDPKIYSVSFLEVGRNSISTITNYTMDEDLLQIKIKEKMADALMAFNEAMDRV